MTKQIFVHLPVKNLGNTIEFFTEIGFTFNSQFTNTNAACMVVGEDSFVMLLTEKYFQTFTQKEICDARKSTEVLIALSVENREEVDELINKATAAGGTECRESQTNEWFYGRSFEDPDGHIWDIMYIDEDVKSDC